MERRVFIIVGICTLLLVPTVAAKRGVFSDVRENYRAENLNPEHRSVRRELDPEEVETEISEAEAVKIIENLGYEPKSSSIALSEANNWNKRYGL